MYFQSDYILRMIETLHTFFSGLLAMLDDALRGAELDRFLIKQCGLNLQSLDALSVDSLIAMLPHTPRLLLSEFQALRADTVLVYEDERTECRYKALRLLLSVRDESTVCEMCFERFLSLYQMLSNRLTADDIIQCFQFALGANAFSTAEDILFENLNTLHADDIQQVCTAGIHGLCALLVYPDDLLDRGGLPRAEIMEAMWDLKQLQGART